MQEIVSPNHRILHHLSFTLLHQVENAHHHSFESHSLIFSTLHFVRIVLCYCLRISYQHGLLIRPYLRTSFNQYIFSHCTNYLLLVPLISVKKYHQSRHYSYDIHFTQLISFCIILAFSNL